MSFLNLKRGEVVAYNDRNVIVGAPLEGDKVIVHDPGTGSTAIAPIGHLGPSLQLAAAEPPPPPLPSIKKEDWERAQKIAAVINPLIQKGRITKVEAEAAAKELGTSGRTVRRMIARLKKRRQLTALLPRHDRKGGKGRKKLQAEVEAITDECIRTLYLSDQRLTAKDLTKEIRQRCRQASLPPPAYNTVRSRIAALDLRKTTELREGRKAAEDLTRPQVKPFLASRPMELVQFDHTKVDAIIVDEEYRMPIGRAYVTYGIDVYSRCMTGIYVALQAPDTTAIAQCIRRSVLPKEKYLRDLGLEGFEWPVWGKMTRAMVDNAKEFEGNAFGRGLQEHRILLEHRPVNQPWFGGHIESVIKTMMRRVHTLPGTTKSNPAAKGEYDAEGNAILTLRELEIALVLIALEYNATIHSELLTTPNARYKVGVLGDETTMPSGYPPRILNEDRFRLDFLPYEERTIQKYGFVINGIRYQGEVLRRWIGRPEAEGKKFTLAYDKRDMRCIYFLDPDINEYFEIWTWNRTREPFSFWEVEQARELARKKGHKDLDEDLIFRLMDERRRLLARAAEKTKRARRETERERQNRLALAEDPLPKLPSTPPLAALPAPANDAAQTLEPPDDKPGAAEPITEFFEAEDWK